MKAKIDLVGTGEEVEILDLSLRRVEGTVNLVGSFRLPVDKTGASLIKLNEHIGKRKLCVLCLDDNRRLEITVNSIRLVDSTGPFEFIGNGSFERV